MFGSDPLHCDDLPPHIINERHFNRLIRLFEEGTLSYGGQIDPKNLKIAPTLMTDVQITGSLMNDEIFGPILPPILTYETFEQAVGYVQAREHPLALYLFSNDKEHQEHVVRTVSYGGGCINDTVMHLSNPHLPFGGVGSSGMGSYHAKQGGFDTFSHQKSVLESKRWLEIKLRYAPPYRGGKLALIKRLFS